LLIAVPAFAVACGGGGSKDEQSSGSIPSATLPGTLPTAIIVSGTPQPAPGQRYIVQSGDSPASIAEQFGITVEELMAANNITDPASLGVGVELVIPGSQGGTPPPAATTAPAPTEAPTAAPPTEEPAETPPSGQQTYIVQAGDIPETIAAQFGITADALMAANGITDPTSLQVGQELVIPAPPPAQ
jgi:LysM repeat protein